MPHGARTTKYVVKKRVGATFANRTMRWGGVTLLLFDTWWLPLVYLPHWHARCAPDHGIWSALQTLGLTNNPTARTRAKQGALAAAVVKAGGFSHVPVAVLTGIIA